jgi:hypothetical protein
MLAYQCSRPSPRPSIDFTTLPTAGEGSADIANVIEGRVRGARPQQRIVLFARAGQWWVQPLAANPFTTIGKDSTWKSTTHPGSAYAALLVDPEYTPPAAANSLPPVGGLVRAVAIAEGAALAHPQPRMLHFSGYEWAVRRTPPGSRTVYEDSNASVDRDGFLHLRISRKGNEWLACQVELSRSLGYGSYRFVVREVSRFEPGVVLAMSIWDDSGPNKEMDIEISRWGESAGKNAQYVVQPYYIPANVVRFFAPSGRLAYLLVWEPGRAVFTTARDSGPGRNAPVERATHTFSSGIPSAGADKVRLNLYPFYTQRNPLQRDVEVVIERFEFLP